MAKGTDTVKRLLLLCFIGVAVNMAGTFLAGFISLPFFIGGYVRLPLYLDAIGTLLAASLGGYIPGILAGLITNFIKCIGDPSSIYYASLNVLAAVVAAYAAGRKWYKKIGRSILEVLILTLLCGVFGSLLTWNIYGLSEEGLLADAIRTVIGTVELDGFSAQLLLNTVIDFLDKTISVGIVLLILNLIPAQVLGGMRIKGWKQAPLTEKELDRKRRYKFSIQTKIILYVSASLLAMAAIATIISAQIYEDSIISEHKALGQKATAYMPP